MQKISTLIITLFLCSGLLFSQSGELDPSFADGGIFIWDISTGMDTGKEIEVQEDGKIVVAGSASFAGGLSFDFYVTRLNDDGTVDETFGEDGIYYLPNDLGSDLVYDMKILDDGKIMVSGSYGASAPNPEFMLIKLNANGTPDSTFAENGVMIQTIDVSQDYARCFTFNDEGQIIVAGNSHKPGFNYQRNAITRLDANGAVDSTFGEGGVFIWNDNDTYNDINAIEMADDGNIFVAGRGAPFGTDRMVIYKILADGSSLDSTWADNGAVLAPFEGEAYDMIIQSNGSILIAGSNQNAQGRDLVVLSYNQDGTANTNFGIDGVFYLDVNISDIGQSLFEQPDGKILVSGESGGTLFAGPPRTIFSTRMDADGQLDTSWGGTGYVATETSTWMAWSDDCTMQADGKILLVGLSAITNNDLTVIRYGNFVDADQDGYGLGEDCNDDDFAVNPGAEEVEYNGIDDDCNPETPDDDLDGDGFVLEDDCDDTNADINPDAIEIPGNDVDEDCDGLVVGVDEPELAQKFKVYPNPANNMVYIDFNLGTPDIDFIEINDYTGRRVRTIKGTQNTSKVAIPLDGLSRGLWMLTIHTSEGIAVKRVTKE